VATGYRPGLVRNTYTFLHKNRAFGLSRCINPLA
jgi:hypothetical protein